VEEEMKTKKWGMFGVVTLFIVLVGVQVSALSVFVPGNVYQTLTDNGKTKYVVGVIDGLAVSGMDPFVECASPFFFPLMVFWPLFNSHVPSSLNPI
jgi:uncharacterized membrane protein